jgi:predicted DNA binding protein
VVEAENLEPARDLGRYLVRSRHALAFALATEYGIVVWFPATITKGVLEIELVVRRSQVGGLVRALAKAGAEPRLVSLRQDSLRTVPLILTPTQRDLFRHALGLGYYEVPRRITLTALARKVSRSKSSVSRTLATVDRKLAEYAVTALA